MGRTHFNIVYGSIATDPTVVVDLAMAKSNSRIEHSSEDGFLQLLLDASIEDAEKYIGSPILRRNVTFQLSKWTGNFIFPITTPVSSITGIEYYDEDGEPQSLELSNYKFIEKGKQVIIEMDDCPDLYLNNDFPIHINCVCGYTTAQVPAAIKSAVLLRFSHKEMFREDVPTSYERSFYSALRPLKRWG